MPTPDEMREHSHFYREASENETDPLAKRQLAKLALDFAYAAEENKLRDAETVPDLLGHWTALGV